MKKIRKIAIAVLTFALIISGVIYVGKKAEEVKAATALTPSEDGSYGTLSKADALNTVNTEDDLEGNDIPNYEGYLFAGWFASEEGECTLDTAVATADEATHAKFVKEDTLSVKLQIANEAVTETTDDSTINADSAIRFISSVDSLAYRKIGFVLSYDGMEDPEDPPYYEASDVFERIDSKVYDASNNKVTYEYSPKIVGTKSEYFFTAKWAVPAASKNVDYTVQAYWITLDGTTVYGQSRCVSVADKSESIINMTLDGELTEGLYDGTVAITSNRTSTNQVVNTSAKSVYVTDVGEGYSNVRITLPDGVTVSQFASATTITVGSASGIFRNHNTAYAGTEATIDTSWYDEYPTTETEFVISGSADLYGIASQVNGANPFNNKSIYLISNITVNSGTATLDEIDGWKDNDSPYSWTPIGANASNKRFNGTFDGQGHTISGIYYQGSAAYGGLFGATYNSSCVTNFTVKNSYFSNTISNAYLGSVAGVAFGKISNIKSQAIVSNTGTVAGGIVGGTTNIGCVEVSNCWFDGKLSFGTGSGQKSGAIIGNLRLAAQSGDVNEANIIGCLNTGTIIGGTQQYGGLVGFVETTSESVQVRIADCLVPQNITCTGTAVGAVLGDLYSTSNVSITIENTYAMGDTSTKIVGRNRSEDTAITQTDCGVLTDGTFTGADGWYNTTLDFGTYWSAINEGTPQLTSFAEGTTLDTLGGRGTETEPWTITIGEELKTLANYTESTYDFEGKYIRLGDNITVVKGATVEEVKTNATENWKPIGTTSKSFAGTFDGNGMTISGIYYNGSGANIGLFGQTNQLATIKDFTLVNSYLGTTATGNVCIGSVVGRAYGNFTKIKSTATVESGGSLNGGIAGAVWTWGGATFSDCWFAGTIESNYENGGAPSGGIVGGVRDGKEYTTTIQNCLNTGEIISHTSTNLNAQVGGICGLVAGTTTVNIFNCVNARSVECYAGRVGTVLGDIASATEVTITNCFGIKRTNDDITDQTLVVYGRNGIGEALVTSGNSVLTLEQMKSDAIYTYASVLLETYTDNEIHWVTTDSTPILSCFAD